VSNTAEFLRLPGLSLVDKARLGGTILYASRVRDWRRLEQVTVEAWLTRLSGRRVFDRFWRPLLQAKLGEAYRDASAAFIWATIQRLYSARRSGMKRELFGYVPGGYARVLERLAEHLVAGGTELRLSSPVAAITRDGAHLEVQLRDGSSVTADEVVVTANPRVAARMCPDLTEAERARFDAIRYQGIVCASLLLDRPLSPYYLTNITDDVPFTAVVDMSAFVDADQLAGHGLVYLPRYCPADDPLQRASDDEVLATFLPALERVYPDFTPDRIRAARISRVAEVFPLPTLRYSEQVPEPTTSIPGLHLVSSANIVNGTLNVNETIELAEQTARMLDPSPDPVRMPA
jgi:protoporphyrinogen oxidase